MTPNVSYALLDAAVVAGRGEEPVVGSWSHARLLEECAALGGVLRHLGVHAAVPTTIRLDDHLDAVVAALATARIGGIVTIRDEPTAPVVVASVASAPAAGGRVRLLRGPGVEEPDLEWGVMLRAGRTDPAAAAVLAPEAAYSPERSVADQIAVLSATSAPYEPDELRRLLQV